MKENFFDLSIDINKSPLLATAIHDGHAVRDNLAYRYKLKDKERLREEDPFTGEIARQFDNYIIANRSRFEVDLNRSPEKAVYRKPEDAWGLDIWKDPITDQETEESLSLYHDFYKQVEEKISAIIEVHGFAIVYDLHSYNHRREGPEGPPADPNKNPDIDVLTANLYLDKWGPVLKKFKQVLQEYPYPDGPLDVREEIRFEGAKSHFMQWIIRRFKDKVFVPSIELKKIFMDEWTGEVNREKLDHLKKALKQTEEAVLQEVSQNQKILENK